MMIRLPRIKFGSKFKISYFNLVIWLSVVFFFDRIYLFSINKALNVALTCLQGCLLLCIGVIFAQQMVPKGKFTLRIIIILIFGLSVLGSKTLPRLKYGLILLAGINCDWKMLYKKLEKLYFVGILLTVTLGIVGILPSVTVRRGYSTYGFTHANALGVCMFSLLCCILILSDYQKIEKTTLKSFLIVVTCWVLTDSRTSVAVMFGAIVLWKTTIKLPKLFSPGKALYYSAIALPTFLFILSFIVSIMYDPGIPFFADLDSFANGRLYLADMLMNTLDVNAFGQTINFKVVENAYISGVYAFGLLPMIVEMWIYTYAVKKNLDSHAYATAVCLISFAIHGLTEATTFEPFLNVALLSTFSSTRLNPEERTEYSRYA